MIFAGELKTQFGSKNCVLAGEIIAGELKIAWFWSRGAPRGRLQLGSENIQG